ncbi:MAG TPA: elongation factor Ts [Acholeplasmataceae bacterium]|jgi:elongation factor Ts|nr:elongation factor Ts [Acholeplasmataceae bacterium]
MISAKLVKELREMTGAGMMDCKKALVETNGDLEAAVVWLRENGITKAQKKAGRVAAEGVCAFVVKGNKAVIYEVNSETDFVARNEVFQNLVSNIGEAIVNSDITNPEEAVNAKLGEETVQEMLVNGIATIGENLTLRRVNIVEKTDDQIFGTYSHNNGMIAVLTVLEGNNEEVAKDVCMHIAAMNPKYLDRSSVDAEYLEQERQILVNETLNEGKPEHIVDKIVEGKVQKLLKGICLVDQEFVKDPDLTVGKYAEKHNSKIISFVRLEVGEGIEKKAEDFAAEVMAAVNA